MLCCVDRAVLSDAPLMARLEPSLGLHVDRVVEEIGRPFARVWVARDTRPGSVLGLLIAWQVVDELQILHVASDPLQRRRGIGRALVDCALLHARQQRLETLLLEVRTSNVAALALYRKVGFYATNLRLGYYMDGENAVEMRLDIDPEGGVLQRYDEVAF